MSKTKATNTQEEQNKEKLKTNKIQKLYDQIQIGEIGSVTGLNADEKVDTAADKKSSAVSSKRERAKKASQKKESRKKVNSTNTVSKQQKIQSDSILQIIPLGGLEEIGKNMTVFVCGDDAFIVDCGMAFPDDDLLGIDAVIPDFSFVEQIRDKVRGLIVTHGHEDHIGAIPFLLQKMDFPIYATPLTVGLIGAKLKETGILGQVTLNTVMPGETIELGCFNIEFIHVNHSIPDSVALAITTPAGVVFHTGDFKIDYTPVFGKTADLGRIAEYGENGVLALLCDSTNAENAGRSLSESHVGASFESLFSRTEGKRIIIATFSSNIQRIQQIIDFAENHNRKIAISGRSMLSNFQIAQDLGYLKYKEGTLVDIDTIKNYKPEEIVIITTGSQGEPMSALSRMASGEHRQIKISSKDCIIISATPIPGNEITVTRVINSLLKLGSDVIYESMYEVHASGHACQDEIKLMISLLKPKYFIPIHGEFKHLKKNQSTASSMGIADRNIIIAENGSVIEFQHGKFSFGEPVDSGRILVDGYGVGDVGNIVIRDRQYLSSEGMIVIVCSIESGSGLLISGPDVISRGFIYVKESEDLVQEVKDLTISLLGSFEGKRKQKQNSIQETIRSGVGRFLYKKTGRNPMIIPVIMEI